MKLGYLEVFTSRDSINKELVNILLSSTITVGLALLVYFVNIPHPNLIFMMAMIAFVTLLDPLAGLPPFITALIYSLYLFSTDHNFVSYTSEGVINLLTAYTAFIISLVFISILSSRRKRSISDLKAKNEGLKKEVMIDYLTGIYNRSALGLYINNNLNKELNLLVFDIDNFKSFNDTYGHDFGDEVLRKVCDSLIEVFQYHNCYRFGGDEFVIVEPDIDIKEFALKLDRLRSELSTIKVMDKQIQIQISGGCAHFIAEDVETFTKFFKTADNLLYQAKRSGKNNIVYLSKN